MASDLTDDYIAKAKARLDELQPLLEEAEHLRRALAALDGTDAGGRSEGQRLPLATRERQIVALVRENPGIRAKDLAEILGVSPGRVAQILKEMETRGSLARDGGRINLA